MCKKPRAAVYKKNYVLKENATVQQKWLVSVLNRNNCNMKGLAEKLHISRQTVTLYMQMNAKLPFPMICAICYVTGIPDNAEKVYEAIQKDI